MFEHGDILGDRYRVVEVLSGGMGQIYVCELRGASTDGGDPLDGSMVALKTFQRRYFFDNAARQSFVREASTWLRIADLPHVMPVLGVEEIADQPYVLMPAVPRGPRDERSVADLLELGPLDPQAALVCAIEVVVALRVAGQRIAGLVHGDLKASNVLLLYGSAHLSDFGLVSAIALGDPDLRLEGTWAYRAPELWGPEPAPPSVASDVYAFGALVFEMLVGTQPVVAAGDDREAWAAAHRDTARTVPDGYSTAGMPAALMALALRCLAQAAADRPVDFGEVFDLLSALCDEHGRTEDFIGVMRGAAGHRALHEQFGIQHSRIRGLLSLDEPAQAMEELDAVPPARYDPQLWVLRGIALSMANRADEALEALDEALRSELDDELRVQALSEYALALKRLGRHPEAIELYADLLTGVPDDLTSVAIVNLATVYLEQGDSESSVGLLEPFVRRMPGDTPGLAEAWANLGLGYAGVGRHDEAVSAFGKALVLKPQNGLVRVRLAAVLMDELGRIHEAWSALDAAFDSGYVSREWYVRMLAASFLLDRRDVVQDMVRGIAEQVPKDTADAMVADAVELANRLVERFGEHHAPDAPAPADEPVPTLAPADAPVLERDPEPEPERPGLPFLNIRYYDGMFDFTIDFYDSVDEPGFVDRFRTTRRRATRDLRFAAGGTAVLRGSAFYVTICPACGITILTNRDVGKRIHCRMCGHDSNTRPERGPRFDRIVAEVAAELGTEQITEALAAEDAPGLHVLFVHPNADGTVAEIAAICRRGGLHELPAHTFVGLHLLREAHSRGLVRAGRRHWSVWAMSDSGLPSAGDATPEPVAEVVRELRRLDVTTLSTSLTAEQATTMTETVEDSDEQQLHHLRDVLRRGTADARDLRTLAEILERLGKSDEAAQMACAAIAADEDSAEAWEILGGLLFQQEEFAAARGALAESLARDPTSALVLMMLAATHAKLGDEERAAELYARAQAYTGQFF